MNIKKQILEATLQLIRSEDSTDLNIPQLSELSGISIPDIELNYATIEQVIKDLFEFRRTEHFEKSEEILKNLDPLKNLLHHDLEFTYRVHFFTKKYKSDSTIGKVGRKSLKNTKVRMSELYGQILESNAYLLPEDLQDSALYSQFITHSLFFLTKENLEHILPSDVTKEFATLQVIESLFPKIDLGFQIA
jgi:hypothetical protein